MICDMAWCYEKVIHGSLEISCKKVTEYRLCYLSFVCLRHTSLKQVHIKCANEDESGKET